MPGAKRKRLDSTVTNHLELVGDLSIIDAEDRVVAQHDPVLDLPVLEVDSGYRL